MTYKLPPSYRQKIARFLLPFFVVASVWIPVKAYAVVGLIAPFAVRLGASAGMAYGIEASAYLHAAVLGITFDTSSATSASASATQAGSGALAVNINPKTPVPTPAGWTPPAAGQTQPTPPPTSPPVSPPVSGGWSYYGAFSGMPQISTYDGSPESCASVYKPATSPEAICQAWGGVWNGWNCPLPTGTYSNTTVCLGLSAGTPATCQQGYMASGSNCVVNPASPPVKPADNYCPIIPAPDGATFAPDSNDADCNQLAAGIASGADVQVGAAKVKASDRSITVTRDDGTQTTYQPIAGGGSQLQYLSYNAATDSTSYTTLEFSAPNASTGEVTLNGYSQNSIQGGGSLAGSSPNLGGVNSGGGALSSGGSGAGAASGVGSGSGLGSDYARSGEAGRAADSILGAWSGAFNGQSVNGREGDISTAIDSRLSLATTPAAPDVNASWLPSLMPSASPLVCEKLPISMSFTTGIMSGISGSADLDICPYLGGIRDILGWLYWVGTVLHVFYRFVFSTGKPA